MRPSLAFSMLSSLPLAACLAGATRTADVSPAVDPDAGLASPFGDGDELDRDDEETIFDEDHAALDGLIARLTSEGAPTSPDAGAGTAANTPDGPRAALSPRPDDPGIVVPPAHENWPQTDEQCFSALDAAKIRYTRPDFETPLVQTPVLLDGPVAGVLFRSHWKRPNPESSVMDCRLALALVEVARAARDRGIVEIHYYSAYRPARPPAEPCAKGKAGRRCRAKAEAYRKAKAGKASRHRTALAIDLRWFITASGEEIDLLEAYERKSGAPPCANEPKTERGRILEELACTLHERRVFNVILTPNADRDHHNHFHMDITPNAKWYIIR